MQNEFPSEYVVARARLNSECLSLAVNALLVSTVSSESIFFFFKRREVYKTAITVDYSNSPFLSVQIEIPGRGGDEAWPQTKPSIGKMKELS